MGAEQCRSFMTANLAENHYRCSLRKSAETAAQLALVEHPGAVYYFLEISPKCATTVARCLSCTDTPDRIQCWSGVRCSTVSPKRETMPHGREHWTCRWFELFRRLAAQPHHTYVDHDQSYRECAPSKNGPFLVRQSRESRFIRPKALGGPVTED
jgi:hypothetical protein